MAAMSVIFSNLVANVRPPVTECTGGTSVGNANAGAQNTGNPGAITPATTADRVGAGIVTSVVLLGVTGFFGWITV